MPSPNAPHLVRLTAAESAQFDSLRGLAAWTVAIAHANQIIVAPTFPGAASILGLMAQAAVMVFFVLSGFLISKSVRGNVVRHEGRFSAVQYTMDRVLRIWPPLLFSIALTAFLYVIAPKFFPSGTHAFVPSDKYAFARPGFVFEPIAYLGAAMGLTDFFLFAPVPSANGPLWSLSIEIWYYLLAAILAWPRGGWKLLSVIGAVALFYIGWNNDQFFYYLPVWWAGYLLSCLHDRRWIPDARLLLCIFALFDAAAAFCGFESLHTEGRTAWHFLVMFNVTIGLCFACGLALILKGRLVLPPAFQHSAAYSYTLYVIHVPMLLFAFGVFQTWILGSINASIGLSLLTLTVTYVIAKTAAKVLENRKRLHFLLTRRSAQSVG